jgi:drug/metabolite transporter (DMT)-like permease
MIDPAALLAILTAFLYAIASIITRSLGKTENGVSMAFYLTVTYIINLSEKLAFRSPSGRLRFANPDNLWHRR